jgi:hypothetical protein
VSATVIGKPSAEFFMSALKGLQSLPENVSVLERMSASFEVGLFSLKGCDDRR